MLLGLTVAAAGQVTVPDRPSKPLFRGQQGERRSSEIAFNAPTNTVTVKLPVEDVNGFFIPNLRRNNFVVYEDGVRQKNVTVEVEHAPITLAVLMEMGGRSQQLNKMLANETSSVLRPLLDVLGRDDKLALFTYDDELHTLVDFAAPRDKWDAAVTNLPKPKFSEANFYDATIAALDSAGARFRATRIAGDLDWDRYLQPCNVRRRVEEGRRHEGRATHRQQRRHDGLIERGYLRSRAVVEEDLFCAPLSRWSARLEATNWDGAPSAVAESRLGILPRNRQSFMLDRGAVRAGFSLLRGDFRDWRR